MYPCFTNVEKACDFVDRDLLLCTVLARLQLFPGDDQVIRRFHERKHAGAHFNGRRRVFGVIGTEARASPKMRALSAVNQHLLHDGGYGSSIPQRLSADVDTPADLVHLDQGVPQEEGGGVRRKRR